MPSDIRSFFGGNAGANGQSSQEKAVSNDFGSKSSAPKPKPKGKRKVLSDSEDENPTKASRKVQPAKRKEAPPLPEETTASDYFARRQKPLRSSPSEVKPPGKTHSAISKVVVPKKAGESAQDPKTPIRTDEGDRNSELTRSVRSSTRSENGKPYKEAQINEEDPPLVAKDEDSGEDVHHAAYTNGRGKADDDYESSGGSKAPTLSRKKGAKGRKRKSAALSDDESSEDLAKDKKKTNLNAKAKAPKKPKTAPQRKPAAPEDMEMQNILDQIPTIKAPTPPPKDPDQKFDFRTMASHAQAAPLAGAMEIPEGAENCLSGLTFVFTGLLDSLGREEGQNLVKRYGGKVTGTPSSKTSYVVLGNDAGPKKLETISKCKLKTINEEGLFALIKMMPANGGSGAAAAKASEKRGAEDKKAEKTAREMDNEMAEAEQKRTARALGKEQVNDGKGPQVESRLWTVKHAPYQLNHICGNKAQVERLQRWLRDWQKNAKSNFKKGGPDGFGLYRAIIIHGSPGIGKTTAAHLVARLQGYDVVESNASDTRSKKLIENGLKGVSDTTSLHGYLQGGDHKIEASKKKLVLIMDEVDGMSAGDRGGVGAMAAVCRKTRIPIILICNERKLPKMKPFDFVTYDLPFRKPTTDQVRSRIMSILYREGMNTMMPTNVLNSLIEGAGADIRRIINMVSTIKLDQAAPEAEQVTAMSFDESKKMASAWEKNVILRPWDITQKILGGGLFAANSKVSINEKAELYFNDHEFSPLMLQENYLSTDPILARGISGRQRDGKILELTDQAAESISDGDLVDAMIHGPQQHWSLMPLHAVFSFVRPASFVSGTSGGRVQFTAWLGNNSKGVKLARCVKEIQGHMRLRAQGDRHEIRQQYLPLLWTKLIKALELHGDQPHGLDDIIELMDSYFLTKDDWDAIYELGVGSQAVEKVSLATRNKANFTRKYNAASHPLPFMKAGTTLPPAKKGKEKPDLEEAIEESEDEEVLVDVAAEEGDDALDLKTDKYVRAPKKKAGPKKGAGKVKSKEDDQDSSGDGAQKPAKGAKRGRLAGTAKGNGKK